MIDLRTISDRLAEIEPGLWQGDREGEIAIPDDAHDALLELEVSSYWFEHRNQCIASTIARFPPEGPLFDIGGGNGFVAQGLVESGIEVVVVEPMPSGARNARRRGLEPVVCGTFEANFRRATLPAVGLFDVVEHIEQDEVFLRDVAERLQPAGRLYVTVPAFQWLWSAEDVLAGHWRRYTQRRLREVITRAGFQVEWSTYFFAPLVIPILLLRALPGRLGLGKLISHKREFKTPAGVLGRLLQRKLARELATLHSRRKWLGSSLLLVARR